MGGGEEGLLYYCSLPVPGTITLAVAVGFSIQPSPLLCFSLKILGAVPSPQRSASASGYTHHFSLLFSAQELLPVLLQFALLFPLLLNCPTPG